MKKFLLLTAVVLVAGCTYSEGDRVGKVTKLSQKGIVCKSWEGELLSGIGSAAKPFEFSVKDEAVVKQLQELMAQGKDISVHYEQKKFRLPCTVESEYLITAVSTLASTAP